MDNVVRSVIYAKIDQIMNSDNMINLIVSLEDGAKFNLKVDGGSLDLFLGCIYEFEIGRYANSEKNNGYVISYKHVTEIEDTKELNDIYRKFMNASTMSYDELKAGIDSYIAKLHNKIYHDIVKNIVDRYERDFYLYPAATKLHHAYIGGLAYHTLGMLNLAKSIIPNYPYLDEEMLYAGVILHDIGKVVEFSGVENTEYAMKGQLLGHLLIGCNIIEEEAIRLGVKDSEEVLMLSHMVASHHGVAQFGAIKKPATAEAAMLWFVDSIDSKFRVLGEELAKVNNGEFTEPVGVMDRVKFYKHN